MQEQLAEIAERFMRGVYSGDTAVVDHHASEDIVVSYPVFERLFGQPTIRGRNEVKDFAIRFSERWRDGKLTIYECIGEGNKVVFVWGFSARDALPDLADAPPSNRRDAWGGITFYRFDSTGQIELEMGEESTPGPINRTKAEHTE